MGFLTPSNENLSPAVTRKLRDHYRGFQHHFCDVLGLVECATAVKSATGVVSQNCCLSFANIPLQITKNYCFEEIANLIISLNDASPIHPKLSIVILTKNSMPTLIQTLYSLTDIECEDYEVLFVDGGSTDGTLSFISELACLAANKYRVLDAKIEGIFPSMNAGAYFSRGRYIWFLNSDDFLLDSTYPGIAIDRLDSSGGGIVFGRLVQENYEKTNCTLTAIPDLATLLRFEMNAHHPTAICSRDLFKNIWFSSRHPIMADYQFMLQAKSSGTNFYFINSAVTAFRSGGNSKPSLDLLWDFLYIRHRIGKFRSPVDILRSAEISFKVILKILINRI